jgi:transposase InsO family protein
MEALAVIWGIKKHRLYLERNNFLVYTDHSSLQWLLNTKEDRQPRLWRWAMFLQAYDFTVTYTPGKLNLAADALSRHPLPDINSVDSIKWSEEQKKDPKLQGIIKDISAHSQFLVNNDILYKVQRRKRAITKNHLYIVVPAQLVNEMITHYHSSAFAGHCGIRKTIAKISSHRLWWFNMQHDVTQHCLACQSCQRIKGNRSHTYHQGSTTGESPFQRVALDYWGPLPASTSGNKYILVALDTYIRFVELYPTQSTNHQEFASAFYNCFIFRHGVPKEILSDNGVPFNSLFSTQVINLIGSENLFAPAYHFASNGAVERFMKTLRNMIFTYTNNDIISNNWD